MVNICLFSHQQHFLEQKKVTLPQIENKTLQWNSTHFMKSFNWKVYASNCTLKDFKNNSQVLL